MDALTLLIADHNRVRGLIARFEEAEEANDTAQLTALATTLLTELEVHTTIEEEIFYPEISAASDEIREVVTEGVEEHHVVKVLAAEIEQLPAGDEVWVAKCKVMIENVDHHAEEEETEVFPQVAKAFSRQALADMGERMEARKASLGAPTVQDKAHLSIDDLHRLASQQQIPGRSKMDREELVATVAPE